MRTREGLVWDVYSGYFTALESALFYLTVVLVAALFPEIALAVLIDDLSLAEMGGGGHNSTRSFSSLQHPPQFFNRHDHCCHKASKIYHVGENWFRNFQMKWNTNYKASKGKKKPQQSSEIIKLAIEEKNLHKYIQ